MIPFRLLFGLKIFLGNLVNSDNLRSFDGVVESPRLSQPKQFTGGEPKRDGGGGFLGGRVSGKGKRNGEVVREGVAKARGERTEVGWVVKDRNRRGGERGREERGRNKNTVETRGVGKFTSGVSSNVEISVFVVRNFRNRKTRLKKREGRQKRGGRKRGRKIGRVLRRFNEIEIASKEGRERTINRKKGVD